MLLPSPGSAAQTEHRIVKVGWYQSDMFQKGISDKEEKSGYCYDYLQKVADYTNWQYEYVYGNWTELFRKLRKRRFCRGVLLGICEKLHFGLHFADTEDLALYSRLYPLDLAAPNIGGNHTNGGYTCNYCTRNDCTPYRESRDKPEHSQRQRLDHKINHADMNDRQTKEFTL